MLASLLKSRSKSKVKAYSESDARDAIRSIEKSLGTDIKDQSVCMNSADRSDSIISSSLGSSLDSSRPREGILGRDHKLLSSVDTNSTRNSSRFINLVRKLSVDYCDNDADLGDHKKYATGCKHNRIRLIFKAISKFKKMTGTSGIAQHVKYVTGLRP